MYADEVALHCAIVRQASPLVTQTLLRPSLLEESPPGSGKEQKLEAAALIF
jgi:hypothetical protein